MVLASILVSFWEPFGILFPYFFGIDFRMPFWMPQILKKSQLGGFWSDFGPKAINQKNPDRYFLRLFQEPNLGINFWVILGRFGLHFWWFWDDNPTFFSYNSGLHFWWFWDDNSTIFSYTSGLCNHTLAQFSTRDFNTVCHIFKFIFGYVWSYILWYLVYLVSLIGL